MAANIPADPLLTFEQELAKRLILIGWQIRSIAPGSDRYRTVPDYGRTRTALGSNNQTVTLPDPIETYQVTFEFDPLALATALACGDPLYEAVKTYPDPLSTLDCAIPPPPPPTVDPQFQLTVLVDDANSIPVDDNQIYLIEG